MDQLKDQGLEALRVLSTLHKKQLEKLIRNHFHLIIQNCIIVYKGIKSYLSSSSGE